jgi:plastocyanin
MRRTRIAQIILVAVAALVAATAAADAPAKTVLNGTVGPGFSISLKDAAGHKLTKLKPGAYTVRVSDKGSIHDFHLKGPGVDKVITSVGFTGTKSAVVTLKAGKYTYVCDPHASSMKGSFTVG